MSGNNPNYKRPKLTMSQLRFINQALTHYTANFRTLANLSMAKRINTAIGVVPEPEQCVELAPGLIRHEPDCEHDITELEAVKMSEALAYVCDACGKYDLHNTSWCQHHQQVHCNAHDCGLIGECGTGGHEWTKGCQW